MSVIVGCSNNNTTEEPEKAVVNEENPGSENHDDGEDISASEDNNFYQGPEGWSFEYPKSWDRKEDKLVQETSSGKTIVFDLGDVQSQEELETWIQSEIDRKLSGDHANQSLVKPLSKGEKDGIWIYRYTIHSDSGDQEAGDIPTVVFFDGSKRYVFHTHMPDVTAEEFDLVINTFNQSSVQVPSFPKNENGQTYGSAADATSPYTEPDLIKAYGVDGTIGYVMKKDLDGEMPKTPEEALAKQRNAPASRTIPLYDVDGKTVIGEFKISNGVTTLK